MDDDSLKEFPAQQSKAGLDISTLLRDPVAMLRLWLDQAIEGGEAEPTAMCLATSSGGIPSARMVLLKEIRQQGLVFFTNYLSRKSRELTTNEHAAAVMFWPLFERQVRVEGTVTRISFDESVEYFNSRPRASRIAAIVSPQSQEIPLEREWLDQQVSKAESELIGSDPQMPDFWGGLLLVANRFEFWQGRPDRLHDRIVYSLNPESGRWDISRLAP